MQLVRRGKDKKGKRNHRTIDRLPEDKRLELDLILVKGNKTLKDVANLIQGEWGMLTDIQHASLVKRLVEYRKHEIHGSLFMEEVRPDGSKVVVRPAPIEKEIDVHHNLIELIEVHKSRLTKLLIAEAEGWRENGSTTANMKVSESVRKELDQYSRLLKQMSDLQFDMGLLSRVPKKVKQEITALPIESKEEQERLEKLLKAGDAELDANHEVFAILERLSGDAIDEAEIVNDNTENEPKGEVL